MIKKFKLFELAKDKTTEAHIEDLKRILSHFNSVFDNLGYDYNGYYYNNTWSSDYRKDGNFMFELKVSYELGEKKLYFLKNFYGDEVDFIQVFIKSLNGLTIIDTNTFESKFNITNVNELISEVTLDNFLTKKEIKKYNL